MFVDGRDTKLWTSRIPSRTLSSLRSGTLFAEFDEYETVDVPNLVEDSFFVEAGRSLLGRGVARPGIRRGAVFRLVSEGFSVLWADEFSFAEFDDLDSYGSR